MPRRPLTPPPSPSPQTPPTPAVPAAPVPGAGLPSHLQRPKVLELEQFPQTNAFRSGLSLMDDRHAAVTDLFNRARAGDPVALQTLYDREAQSNFGAYGGVTQPTPGAPEDPNAPSIANGGYGRDVIDSINSGIGGGVHEIAKAGVHGLGFLARQGEGLTNAVFGTESGIAGELVDAYDAFDAQTRLADGSTYTPKTIPGMVAQPLAQGGTGFVAGGPVVGGVKALAQAPALAQGIMRGGLADMMAFDPMAPRASNLYNDFVTEQGGQTNIVTDTLAQQPGDSELAGRLKNVSEGGIIGTALEGTMRGLGGLYRGLTAPSVRAPEVPLPPEVLARGEFEPVPGGPAPGASPFQQDLAPGMFGEGPGASPFGGEFPIAPRPDITPEMRSTTVSADPVLTGPEGRPALPDIQRGDFVPTATRRATDDAGLPQGRPGEFVGTPEALTGPGPSPRQPAPAELPDVYGGFPAPRREGFNQFDPAPAEFEGYFKPAPRRPDIQPQPRDPSGMGVEPPVTGPFPRTGGIDPNAETRVGPTALDPVEGTVNYTRPSIAPGERMARARSEDTPGDPYAETFRQSKLRPDEQLDQNQVDIDQSLAETQDAPVVARSLLDTEAEGQPLAGFFDELEGKAQAGDLVTPRESRPVRPDIAPARGSDTTLRDVPVVPAKPGLSHLSPAAQEWVSKLKPGEREALTSSIAHFRRNPDPEGDLGNLKQVLAFKKPGSRARSEGATPSPKAEPLAVGEGMTRSPRIESDLVQAGFRRRGDTPPETPVDTQAPTERITKPEPLFDADRPKAAGIDPKDLKPLYDAVSGIAQSVGDFVKGGVDLWSKRLYKVVGDMPGGTPAAEKAKKTLDRTRQLQGQFDADRQRFIGEMRGRSLRAKAARASFAEVDWDGEAGFARINDVLDGEVEPRPHELPAVKAYRQAFLDTGRAAEKAGYQIAVGDKLVPFKVDPKRQRAPRIGTRDLYWYASRPADPETQRLAEIIAEYNPGMTKESVLKELNFWNEKGVSKRGLAEDARTIEHFPTHYRTKEGRVVQLLENDPQRIIDAVTRRFPARVAYVENFGQGGVPKELADIQAASGPAGQAAAQNLFRALNGIPLDDLGQGLDTARPGSKASWAQRALNVPWTAWKGLKLSMAPLANIPETLGKARAMGAGARVDRLIKAGFDVSFLNRNSGALVDDLANRGALTRDTLDWFYNKSDVPETLNRYTLNTTGYVNQMVNEFNEKLMARLADGWAGLLKKGDGGAIDRFRLKVLEFRPDQIDEIMSGKASPKVYNDVIGRAVEWAQGSTSQAAERSRAGGSRLWNLVTIADRFAQMNINRNFDAWAKAGKALADGNASWKDRLAGVAFAADLTAGQTAAAALTLALRATVVGGGAVLADKAFGSPAGLQDYLLDAMSYALLGGPVQAVVQTAASDDRSVAESLTGGLLPVSTIQSMKDMFIGEGRYEEMTALESAGEFLRSGTPIAPAVANIAASVGIAQDDPELDASISAYWKWRSKYAKTGRMEGQEADTTGFRAAMRKAVNAMRDGEDPSEAINAALAAKGGKTVRQSLQGKRLLKGLKPEQLAELREYLGERTMTKLEQYDALLDAWAAVAYRPKR